MTEHVFDQAMALTPDGAHAGHFTGTTSPDYWNMVGPFGGTTAALMLQAVLRHPDLLGTPVALTVNYAGAVGTGAFELQATPVRTNRSTQHWTVQMSQVDAEGRTQVTTTATAFTALRRETWNSNDLPLPPGPGPAEVARLTIGPSRVEWVKRFEMRPLVGTIPTEWDGRGDASETRMWLRDDPPRPLDFASLASMADTFFPRIWLRRAKPVPVGTVSITTYFHVDAAGLAEVGDGYLLARATGQQFSHGYFDQAAQLWSEAGKLLATSNQIVYYKE